MIKAILALEPEESEASDIIDQLATTQITRVKRKGMVHAGTKDKSTDPLDRFKDKEQNY